MLINEHADLIYSGIESGGGGGVWGRGGGGSVGKGRESGEGEVDDGVGDDHLAT